MVPLSTQESLLKVDFSNVKYCDNNIRQRVRPRETPFSADCDTLHTLSLGRLSLPAILRSSLSLFDAITSLSLSLFDTQNHIPHETPRNGYTWPRIDTLLSLENKALDSRLIFSTVWFSATSTIHPGRGRPLVERATHRVLILNLSLPLLLFHDYDYFFRPFFARFDTRVDDLEEEPRPFRLLLLLFELALLALALELELALALALALELLDAPPSPPSTAHASSSTCSPTDSSIFITAVLCAARSSSSFPNDCFSFALFSSLF